MKSSKKAHLRGVKKTFLKLGSCSRTLGYILNREFENPKEDEEHALDPMAGGIFQQGYQCGMLWGTSLAVGTESYRRYNDSGKAIAYALKGTQNLMESFTKRTGSIDCYDITQCDFNKKRNLLRFVFSGKAFSCFRLAERWAPEAIEAATEGISPNGSDLPQHCMSCATEVVRKMDGSDEEMHMVAGFAGGLGLSGGACGALSAAIWMKSLSQGKGESGKFLAYDKDSSNILETFYHATDFEILCSTISGKKFKDIEEHTDFIKNGGCENLINVLAAL